MFDQSTAVHMADDGQKMGAGNFLAHHGVSAARFRVLHPAFVTHNARHRRTSVSAGQVSF